jgi:hypothetical protein
MPAPILAAGVRLIGFASLSEHGCCPGGLGLNDRLRIRHEGTCLRVSVISRVLLGLAALSCVAAWADPPSHPVQEGPSGYSVACALSDQPGMGSCADLPAAQACTHEPDFPSVPSQQATGMTFVNRSDQVIAIYWLDFHGTRKLYHSLPPGGRIAQDTFIGHNWLIAQSDGRCIGIFKATPESLAFF